MTAFDALTANRLRAELGPSIVGREVVALEETTSTNDSVLERSSASTPEGLVVFAERQTAGRGQRSNPWESAAGKGLWFSILLRPNINIGEAPRLAEWSARTVAETISKMFALPVTLKLPNDVMVAGKKVAGVLVEMRAQPNAPHIAIVGIGINVNHQPEDFSVELRPRAISLAIALERDVDRHQLAVELLKNLNRTYADSFGR